MIRAVAFCVCLLSTTVSLSAHADERPNVLLFFIDDLGYRDLGCYGSEFYRTPNIDRLARTSLLFTDAYSANPVCSPTRAALMTGKAPQRMSITQWISQPSDKHLPLNEFTFAEAFGDAGYDTGYIGKWHLGEKQHQMPTAQGFQWMRGVNRAGQPSSYFFPFAGRERNGVAYWDVPDLDQGAKGDYLTDKLTDQAISFIKDQRQNPFLLCFAHYAVHTPIESPPKLVTKYSEIRNEQFGVEGARLVDERHGAKTRIRQDDAKYAAMIENLDTNVGRVLDALSGMQLRDNTIVIFTSDNGGLTTTGRGGPTSVRPLRAGKGWTYEGGIRVPLLISWPEKITAAKTDVPAITMDLYPTLLQLAGLPMRPEQHLDGIPLILDGTTNLQHSQRTMAWYYPHRHGSKHRPSSAIRVGDRKLVHCIEEDRYELYDLKSDLSESKNLAASEPLTVERLAKQLDAWIDATVKKND